MLKSRAQHGLNGWFKCPQLYCKVMSTHGVAPVFCILWVLGVFPVRTKTRSRLHMWWMDVTDVTRPLFPNTGGNYMTPNVFKRCSLMLFVFLYCCLCVWRLYLNVFICTSCLNTLNSGASQRGELNNNNNNNKNQNKLIRRHRFTMTQDVSSRHKMYTTQHPRGFAMWEWDWAKRGRPRLPGRRWWEGLWSGCKVRTVFCEGDHVTRALVSVGLIYATVVRRQINLFWAQQSAAVSPERNQRAFVHHIITSSSQYI